jgi:hypothetical protein
MRSDQMQSNVTLNEASRHLLTQLMDAQAGHLQRPDEPFLVAHFPNGRVAIWRGDLLVPIDSSLDTLQALIDAGYAGWSDTARSLRRLTLRESSAL